uniref:Uncharacterized protein n=1 Tax=Cannabis sativa TaxID=3483 RepID=A0A803Q2A5_CANSA
MSSNTLLWIMFQNVRKGFAHPNMITALCAKAGVKYSTSKQTLQPQHIFDKNAVIRFVDTKTKKTLTFSFREEPPSVEERSRMTMPERLELIENGLASITKDMKQQHQEMREWAMYQDDCARMNAINFGIDISAYP